MAGATKNIEESRKMVAIVACPLGKLKSVSRSKLLIGLTLSITGLIIKGNTVPSVVAIVSKQKALFLFFRSKNNPKTRNMKIDSGTLHTFVTESIVELRVWV